MHQSSLTNQKARQSFLDMALQARRPLIRLLVKAVCIFALWIAFHGNSRAAGQEPRAQNTEAESANEQSWDGIAKSASAQSGRVIGLDLLSSHYFGMWQMWKRAGLKDNAAEAMDQMLKYMKANPHLARMALQRLDKEHAKFHPHMTKDCSLLKGLGPNDQFDAAGHAQAIISDSLACPICNPPPSSDDGRNKPNPRPGNPGDGTPKQRDADRARDSLRHAEAMKWLSEGMNGKYFDTLSDAEAIAIAELWTDYVAPGGQKTRSLEFGARVAQLAESMKDSTDYATPSDQAKYPYTCNRFVYDVLNAAGMPVPLRERRSGLLQPKYPPLAGDYADPIHDIPGLPVVHGIPRVGDIVAIPIDSDHASGHVGIVVAYDSVTGDGRTVSVSSSTAPFTVREGRFGFRPGDGSVVFRRPTWLGR